MRGRSRGAGESFDCAVAPVDGPFAESVIAGIKGREVQCIRDFCRYGGAARNGEIRRSIGNRQCRGIRAQSAKPVIRLNLNRIATVVIDTVGLQCCPIENVSICRRGGIVGAVVVEVPTVEQRIVFGVDRSRGINGDIVAFFDTVRPSSVSHRSVIFRSHGNGAGAAATRRAIGYLELDDPVSIVRVFAGIVIGDTAQRGLVVGH